MCSNQFHQFCSGGKLSFLPRVFLQCVSKYLPEGGREGVREGPIRDIELLVGAKNKKAPDYGILHNLINLIVTIEPIKT